MSIIFEFGGLEIEKLLPYWFIELTSQIPLIGTEFGFQEFEPEEDFDGISYMLWNDTNAMIEESMDYIPGCAIFESGFICIASCSLGSGDPFFIPINKGDNPPVFRVFHEFGENTDEILKEGMELVSERLSDLFKKAII
ncbi:hypothetical protein [Tepidibacter aestuarii]|uniref:hypothetical protein n=1 Tax=Tepidibacter aestuarii TaxID=2925782 RepID=UPI0020BF6714|nr:hypothetical protein [Tepidibacter aestuarii]CAH2215173.1 protein of unknown function [Tepidibacter aestuarii]